MAFGDIGCFIRIPEGDIGQQRRGNLPVEVLQLNVGVGSLVDVPGEALVLQGELFEELPVSSIAERQGEDGHFEGVEGRHLQSPRTMFSLLQ